jgi:hypothetical protein
VPADAGPQASAAAPPAEEEIAPPPVPDDPDALTVADVHARWNTLMKAVKRLDKKAPAMLKSGRLTGVRGGAIVLTVASDLLKEKIEAEANRRVIEQALEEVFGLPLTVECRVHDASQQGKLPEMSDLLSSDSVIASAVNDLGGQISDIQPGEPET